MKVSFFAHKPSGCNWYRIEHPMNALAAHGIETRLVHVDEETDDDSTAFQLYGAVPFSYEKPLQWMKETEKKIIYDADDALDLIEPSNPFFYEVKKDTRSVREVLPYADHVTVSTHVMAEYMRTKTDKPITVVPNCFDPKEWTFQRPNREGIRIGFAGSSTHIEDLILVLPAIRNLQARYPDLKFIIMGFAPHSDYRQWYKEFRYVSTDEGIKQLETMDKLLSEISFEFVPFVDTKNYPATLTNMALDIGLCPLALNAFNRHRSACKAMEYTLSGALALASDIEPYRMDRNSILVDDWEEQIEFFIKNPAVARNAQKQHLKWTIDNRDINSQIEVLESIYK